MFNVWYGTVGTTVPALVWHDTIIDLEQSEIFIAADPYLTAIKIPLQ